MRRSVIKTLFAVFLFATFLGIAMGKTAIPVDYKDADDIEDIVITYHKTMNEFLNEKMEDFMKLKTPEALKNLDTPPEVRFKDNGEPNLEPCGNNTSTWCVSMLMTEEFFAFREKLLEARKRIIDDISKLQARAETRVVKGKKPGESEEKVSKAFRSEYGELTTELQRVDGIVERELKIAQRTLELSLAAYNEFHIAWSIHTKNLEFIDLLEDYRNALSGHALSRGIRNQIELYPSTFFNAQSSQCT